MMSRITIHLKRAGDRIRDTTTLSAPHTIFFNRERHRRQSSTRYWDHPFDTPEPRLSADQTPLPPPSPSTIDDVAERVSTTSNHHDSIHKPLPLVLARPRIPDIQIV